MHVRHPVWLQGLGAAGARSFAVLFALESFTRAIIATVIPLQVLKLVGDPEDVSMLFFSVSLVGLCVNFTIPLIVRLLSRRMTYTLGASMLVLAGLSLATGTLATTALGMLLRVFGVSCFAVCLSLYILDYLKGRELNELEPLRLVFAATAWTVGPLLGVVLWTRLAQWLPFAVSSLSALATLGYFWFLRASDNRVIVKASSKPANPFLSIRGFFQQQHLSLAWLIATVRSAWWVMFFIYAPIYAVHNGLGAEVGGLMVSAGNGLLFLAPAVGRIGKKRGVRWVLTRAFLYSGIATAAIPLVGALGQGLGAALLVLAAIFAVALDVTGNLPFLRSVRPSQRASMTTVFVTYRDMSEIATPGIFSLLLKALPLEAVFLASGASMLTMAWLSRFVPRRM